MIALELAAVSRRFASGAGVGPVDLRVESGTVHALVGLNGAGKSTLLACALGMLSASAGSIVVLGDRVPRVPSATWARVGHMLEHPLAYPELTVAENLQVASDLRGVARTRRREAVDAVMEEFALRRHASTRARELSQGNRQRLGLAGALLHRPELIVLDEPTNALDPHGIILLRDAIRRRVDAGAAALISSHHLDEVARTSDRITVLNEGRVVGELPPRAVDLERAFFDLVLETSSTEARA